LIYCEILTEVLSITGSDEELADLKAAYTSCRGDMDMIIDSVLCATVDDEPRFRQILERLIASGSIKAYSAFVRENKSKATERKRKVRKIDVVEMAR